MENHSGSDLQSKPEKKEMGRLLSIQVTQGAELQEVHLQGRTSFTCKDYTAVCACVCVHVLGVGG